MTASKVFALIFLLASQQLVLSGSPCPICEKAKARVPVDNCQICVQDNNVCCKCDGQEYFCQTLNAASAPGGLLNSVLTGLNLQGLIPTVCGILNVLSLDTSELVKSLITCLKNNPTQCITGTCTPPAETEGPTCTAGLCCPDA